MLVVRIRLVIVTTEMLEAVAGTVTVTLVTAVRVVRTTEDIVVVVVAVAVAPTERVVVRVATVVLLTTLVLLTTAVVVTVDVTKTVLVPTGGGVIVVGPVLEVPLHIPNRGWQPVLQ